MPGDRKDFDAEMWAEDHEKLCSTRFESVNDKLRSIFKVLWMGLLVLLGVTGWSLKANYDTAQAQITAFKQASDSIKQQVQSHPNNTTIVVP